MRVTIKESAMGGGIKGLFPVGYRRVAADAMGREWVDIIRVRTAQGKFAAEGSSGLRARRYNELYAKKKGVGLSPVTLEGNNRVRRTKGALKYGGVGMMEAMRHGVRFTSQGMVVGIMFNTARADKLFEIHQELGAGKGRVLRRFVYANAQERQRIIKAGLDAMKRKQMSK